MAKLKICVSIDEDLASRVQKLTEDRKGGFSRWVNTACKKELAREKRRKGFIK